MLWIVWSPAALRQRIQLLCMEVCFEAPSRRFDYISYYTTVSAVGCEGYNPYAVVDKQNKTIRWSEAEWDSLPIDFACCADGALSIWRHFEVEESQNRIKWPAMEYTYDSERKATSQNSLRQLEGRPCNLLISPTFSQIVVDVVLKFAADVEVKIEVRAGNHSIRALFSLGKLPSFGDLSYHETLPSMRGNMAAAAVLMAALRAIAASQVLDNVPWLSDLSDILVAYDSFRPINGQPTENESTNQEDVLLLVNVLRSYLSLIVGNAPPTGPVVSANSTILSLQDAHCGRVWGFPMWDCYSKCSRDRSTDIWNYGRGRDGRSSKAAAFLSEFVPLTLKLTFQTNS